MMRIAQKYYLSASRMTMQDALKGIKVFIGLTRAEIKKKQRKSAVFLLEQPAGLLMEILDAKALIAILMEKYEKMEKAGASMMEQLEMEETL